MSSEIHSSRIPGEAGVWILIFGEMTFFSTLFGAFLYYRGLDVAGFTASQGHLSKAIGLANTLLLLTSSLFVALGIQATDRKRTVAPGFYLAGLACACGFIALKVVEYHGLFAQGIAVNTNTFFGFYFGLTALHLGHVLIGSGILTTLSVFTRAPVTEPKRFALMESGGCFWHMVDLLWIIIFALLYLVE
jgi:nitric oxide reductase NorE protein